MCVSVETISSMTKCYLCVNVSTYVRESERWVNSIKSDAKRKDGWENDEENCGVLQMGECVSQRTKRDRKRLRYNHIRTLSQASQG